MRRSGRHTKFANRRYTEYLQRTVGASYLNINKWETVFDSSSCNLFLCRYYLFVSFLSKSKLDGKVLRHRGGGVYFPDPAAGWVPTYHVYTFFFIAITFTILQIIIEVNRDIIVNNEANITK